MNLVYGLLSMELRKEIPKDSTITEDTFQEYNELSVLPKGSFFSEDLSYILDFSKNPRRL